MQGIVQRYRIYGRIDDASRSGRPTLLSNTNLKAIERVVENAPRTSLNELTEQLHGLKLKIGRTTVDKAIKQLGFKLQIPCKKPFLDEFQKIRRKYWCYRHTSWKRCQWRRIVWLDECKVEFSTTAQPGRKVRIRAGEELLAANLAPSFRSNQITIQCWAAITYGSRTHSSCPATHSR